MNLNFVQRLSDEELIRNLEGAAANERGATVQVIALLAEMDLRRLFLEQGYSSLFVYCTKCLHVSEHAAYGRIEAARAARKFPIILDRLADGSMSLTTICLLSNHLTADNHQRLLDAAMHKTRREVEEQIASLRPLAPVPSVVRQLPQSKTAMLASTEARRRANESASVQSVVHEPAPVSVRAARRPVATRPVVTPLAPERYKIQFTVGRDTHEKLRKVQDLMRHVVPTGDVATIFERALASLLRDVERQKLATVARARQTNVPKTRSRHVPSSVRRAVWARDGGRCAYVGTKGRCEERGFLEFHHVIPFAEGGPTTIANLEVRCRAHNNYEARKWWESDRGDETSNRPSA